MGLLGGALAWLTGETQRQQQAEIEAQRAREMQAQQERVAREALEREQQREAAIRQLEQSREARERQRDQETERDNLRPTERIFRGLRDLEPEPKQPEPEKPHEIEATEMELNPVLPGLQRAPTLAGPGGSTAVSRTTLRGRAREAGRQAQEPETTPEQTPPEPVPEKSPTELFLEEIERKRAREREQQPKAEPDDVLEIAARRVAENKAKEAERLAAMTPAERELEEARKQRDAARERGGGRSFYPDYSRGRTLELRPPWDQG